ncbi:MAG TPA: hypothetical protein VIZ43_11065 [Trebonia sp.]
MSTPSAVHLADGPAMYFGGTIETFALPLGAFIVISVALYFLFRADHAGTRLKYLTTASVSSVTTREPAPAPAPPVANVKTELAADPETPITLEPTEPEPTGPEPTEPETGER